MTRAFWPATLDELLHEPVVAQCPGCPWSAVCPSDVQAGVSLELKAGRFTPPECIWHQRYQQLYRRETGHEPPAAFSPQDLAYTLTERRAVRESGN